MNIAASQSSFSGNWLQFYLDPRGRATRADYNVRGIVIILVGSAIAGWLDSAVFTSGHNLLSTVWNYVSVLLTVAVTARRLHDVNLSGWWQLPFQLLTLGGLAYFDLADLPTLERPEDIMPLLDKISEVNTGIYLEVLAGFGVFLAFLLFLSTKHGTKGANKYGPDLLKETNS